MGKYGPKQYDLAKKPLLGSKNISRGGCKNSTKDERCIRDSRAIFMSAQFPVECGTLS